MAKSRPCCARENGQDGEQALQELAQTESGEAVQQLLVNLTPVQRRRKRRSSRKEREDAAEKDRMDSLVYNLTLDVNELKQQIHRMQIQKHYLKTYCPVRRPVCDTNAAAKLATEYYRAFHHGCRHEDPVPEQFLRSVLADDFTVGNSGHGGDFTLMQWRCYTNMLQQLVWTLFSIDVIECEEGAFIVHTRGELSGRVTRAFLMAVFPHVLADARLLPRLLHQHVSIPCSKRFYINNFNQLTRSEASVDFFSAFLSHLRDDLEGLTRLIRYAQVEDEGIVCAQGCPTSEECD